MAQGVEVIFGKVEVAIKAQNGELCRKIPPAFVKKWRREEKSLQPKKSRDMPRKKSLILTKFQNWARHFQE